MKIEVTEKGVYDAKGKMIEVGTELTIKGDEVPAWLVNKGRVVAEKSAKGAKGGEMIVNPAGNDTVAGSGNDTVTGGAAA